ncbi:Gfo/Idh/MocA family oxidoreductase [Aminobacter sp. AP02]|uniref:Gfo/Idh/MocA family protein n=1 Tax=Aminobacter sp. AP02 TaxID=2135737 RepID=UPI000D6D5DCF|nr:Gfo/Idh/MocA family oxidoreductase [Aminobacter sp. AP02]PWK76880.1 putative dehydrogenase [Aminobacter sp. AP02]
MIGMAVVGYGYWGPNLVRNIADTPGVQLLTVCDLQPERLASVKGRYPAVTVTSDYEELLRDPRIHAIAIATPVSSHFRLAMSALMAGKHVFVEKPITPSAEEAQRLVDEAERRGLVLAVDHTFVHTSAVRKMRELVGSELGDIYYYDSVRVNLGLFQHDVSVIWDLAVHDLSIIDYVIPEKPVAVSATGVSHVAGEPENIAYLNLFFESNLIAHIHVNWLAPVKLRRTLIGGSRQMIVYDDLEPSEKIKVYDKGITLTGGQPLQGGKDVYQMMVGYRTGDMRAPHLDVVEALGSEIREFLHCIEHNGTPVADGQAGLRVVSVLEAATRSLAQRGRVMELQPARRVA